MCDVSSTNMKVMLTAQVWPKDRPRDTSSSSIAAPAVNPQKRHALLLSKQEVSKGMRARFVLDHWNDFSPFFEPHNRDRDGGLGARLLAYEQAALASGRYEDGAHVCVRGQPECIVGGQMREYQVEGLRWLVRQHDLCAGCVLGDEMGLGKTLQIVAFFGFLKFVRKEQGPHLVVAPLSVMNSWANELTRWCPSLKVMVTLHNRVLSIMFSCAGQLTKRCCLLCQV